MGRQRSTPATEHRLGERLLKRRAELEQAALARIGAIADPKEVAHPAYIDGLRTAVRTALDYGLKGIGEGERRGPPPPAALLAQARLAAHSGVGLDTVLRRYFAGYVLIGDFLAEEASSKEQAELRSALRSLALRFDRLIEAVSEEHRREAQGIPTSADRQRAERIKRLLEGELVDSTELAYPFEGSHVAIVGAGPGSLQALREAGRRADKRLLLTRAEGGIAWAWLGGRAAPELKELDQILTDICPPGAAIARGEPAEGLPGWRLSHRQATAALPLAKRGPKRALAYREVALLAAALRDEVLADSLRLGCLAPLEQERDGGLSAKRTLRAYLECQRNVSSTAAALGINRRTVAERLRRAEALLGCSLEGPTAEVEVALGLDQLGATLAG